MIACILAVATAQGVHKPSNAAVIKSSSRSHGADGSYQYQFESDNGISANEAGVAGQFVQGLVNYKCKEVFPHQTSYTFLLDILIASFQLLKKSQC